MTTLHSATQSLTSERRVAAHRQPQLRSQQRAQHRTDCRCCGSLGRAAGCPCPPLSLLLGLCRSVSHWLSADARHRVFFHSLQAHGRSVVAVVAHLLYTGSIADAEAALRYVTERFSQWPGQSLRLLPSQRRYIHYIQRMKDGHEPSSAELLLERVIVIGIPRMERLDAEADAGAACCRPYLQLFNGSGALLFSSTRGGDSSSSSQSSLRWYRSEDDSLVFPVGARLRGDVLFRLRHLSASLQRMSVVRWQLHCGFLQPATVLRLTEADIDRVGLTASQPQRLPEHFTLDLAWGEQHDAGGGKDGDRQPAAAAIRVAQHWRSAETHAGSDALLPPLDSAERPAARLSAPLPRFSLFDGEDDQQQQSAAGSATDSDDDEEESEAARAGSAAFSSQSVLSEAELDALAARLSQQQISDDEQAD